MWWFKQECPHRLTSVNTWPIESGTISRLGLVGKQGSFHATQALSPWLPFSISHFHCHWAHIVQGFLRLALASKRHQMILFPQPLTRVFLPIPQRRGHRGGNLELKENECWRQREALHHCHCIYQVLMTHLEAKPSRTTMRRKLK